MDRTANGHRRSSVVDLPTRHLVEAVEAPAGVVEVRDRLLDLVGGQVADQVLERTEVDQRPPLVGGAGATDDEPGVCSPGGAS